MSETLQCWECGIVYDPALTASIVDGNARFCGMSCYCIYYRKKDEVTDNVNHPAHYTKHPSGVEAIQITEHMSFTLGNALKYIWRADLKNGVEDLEKAVWYLKREIEKRKAK